MRQPQALILPWECAQSQLYVSGSQSATATLVHDQQPLVVRVCHLPCVVLQSPTGCKPQMLLHGQAAMLEACLVQGPAAVMAHAAAAAATATAAPTAQPLPGRSGCLGQPLLRRCLPRARAAALGLSAAARPQRGCRQTAAAGAQKGRWGGLTLSLKGRSCGPTRPHCCQLH